MNTLESVRDLVQHMEWADAAIWNVALASESAGADTEIKNLLHHTHLVQRAFLSIWQQAPEIVSADSDMDIAELVGWGRDYHALVSEYLDTLTEADLDRPVSLPWARALVEHLGCAPALPSLRETLFHITGHSTYHRGQLTTRLYQLGAEPPITDYVLWIWIGKPKAQWPSTAGGS